MSIVKVILFIISLPFTKLRHLVTIPANYILRKPQPIGEIEMLDLEDEQSDRFGASTVDNLTWKDILDSDACTSCQRCQDQCPASVTGKPLSPMKVIEQINQTAFGDRKANLIDRIGRDALWACTTCGTCQQICPANINHLDKIINMRRHLVLMEGEFPGQEVNTAMDQTEVNGNPLGMSFASRADWGEKLGVPIMADIEEADILYFAGCHASFAHANMGAARSLINICHSANIKVAILGKEEKCCGEPIRKLGNEYLYQTLAQGNIEIMKKYAVKRVVTTCPHCFQALAQSFLDFDCSIRVEHSTVFIDGLLAKGLLPLAPTDFSCTIQDSCVLGRGAGIYEEPRRLICAAGGTIKEMKFCKKQSFCCGGGGGRILAEENIGSRISETRLAMALTTGSEFIVTNCPFCKTMFDDAIKATGQEDRMQAMDLVELIENRLQQKITTTEQTGVKNQAFNSQRYRPLA